MAKLMQQHTGEHREDEQRGLQCCRDPVATEKTLAGDKEQQQKERDVNAHLGASEGENAERPFHIGTGYVLGCFEGS